jgi:choline dehydrogenase-like flavoprotein
VRSCLTDWLGNDSGKGLGGSSAINFYVWNLPPKQDIDGACFLTVIGEAADISTAWEELGNEGWNWKNYSKYVKKAETCVPPAWNAFCH